MPTADQINQIDQNTNNSLDPVTDATTGTFYNGLNKNTIRCSEGYVFDGSHVLSSNGLDLSVLKYTDVDPTSGLSQWMNSDGSPAVGVVLPSITCVQKFCGPQGITNSDKEFDVLVDTTEHQDIECNDGYVFDTTNTKMGSVKCGVIPIMDNEGFNKENEVAWMVTNPVAENTCASNGTQDDCVSEEIPFIISKATNKIYDQGDKSLKCTWIPDLDDESDSGFKRVNGQCKFIHRADFNDSEPICKSMYCSNKSIPYSNRTDGALGQLPGPETGSMHGDCVNFDGQIIDNITNSSDCACFQHKSCNTCTSDTNGNNCQWCGYDDTGQGGFCYSSKTYLDICTTSVRNDRGGTCTHVKKTEYNKSEEITPPEGGWDRDGCENDVCVKADYWDNTIATQGNDREDKSGENYNIGAISESECTNDNYTWDDGINYHQNDTCILKNKKINGLYSVNSTLKYYPVSDGNGGYKLNISDKICVPNEPDGTSFTTHINTCDSNNKSTCVASNNCKWIDNDLRDSIFNWSSDKKIYLPPNMQALPTCPIYTGDESGVISITKDDNYIKLINEPGKLDLVPASSGTITDDSYINDCSIQNFKEESNIFDEQHCVIVGGTHTDELHTCEPPNTKYCSASDTTNDPTVPACPLYSKVLLNDGTTSQLLDGCLYYDSPAENPTGPADYQCYRGLVTPRCYPENTDPYNCEIIHNNHDVIAADNMDTCLTTNYTSSIDGLITLNDKIYTDYNEKTDDINFKNYLVCDTDKTTDITDSNDDINKGRCNMIGQDYAHWGILCSDPTSGNNYPGKHICEYSSSDSTWGKYLDGDGAFDYGCFKNDGSKYEPAELCGLMNSIDGENVLTDYTVIKLTISSIAEADTIVIGSSVTINGTAGFIVAVDLGSASTSIIVKLNSSLSQPLDPTFSAALSAATPTSVIVTINSIPYTVESIDSAPLTQAGSSKCIIDRYGFSEPDDPDEYQQICENYSNHSIGYQFIEKVEGDPGACKHINSDSIKAGPKNTCETNNKEYVKEYNYNDLGTCGSIGPARSVSNPDIPTDWTGGEISNDGVIHRSECSPSIMNSCNVDCEQGYGGGGEYICQYNERGGDICDDIDKKTALLENGNIDKSDLCNSYPACEYNGSTCSHKADVKKDGHLEWIGSPCYKIDNTAFSHGIAKLPELDKFIPPFIRVVIYMSIYTVIAILLIILLVKFGLKLIGGGVDFSINTTFNSVNKIIDVITDSDKVVRKIILSEGVKNEHKAGYMIFTVGVFIGSYYLFQYIKNYIKNSWSNITNYIRRLKSSSFRMPSQISQAIGTGEEEVGTTAGQAAGQAAGQFATVGDSVTSFANRLTGIDLHANVEFDNLTTIIQTLVGGTVIFIIIALVVKSDLIGKVGQKKE
jgi:hypothetical protein